MSAATWHLWQGIATHGPRCANVPRWRSPVGGCELWPCDPVTAVQRAVFDKQLARRRKIVQRASFHTFLERFVPKGYRVDSQGRAQLRMSIEAEEVGSEDDLVLSPRRTFWSAEEDALILQTAEALGITAAGARASKWREMSRLMPNRSSEAVRAPTPTRAHHAHARARAAAQLHVASRPPPANALHSIACGCLWPSPFAYAATWWESRPS